MLFVALPSNEAAVVVAQRDNALVGKRVDDKGKGFMFKYLLVLVFS